MEKDTKYRAIFETLHAEILAGKYADGARLPSEEALCRKWDVSRPTVARAMKALQLQGLIDRRAGAGSFVRFQEKSLQISLGLLVDGLGKTEILDPICAEITRAAQARGCSVFTGGLPEGISSKALAENWASKGVRGVFFAPFEHGLNRESRNLEIVQTLRQAGLSVVLVDRDAADFPTQSPYDLVSMDNFHAGYLAGEHLAAQGCRRIVFVARPEYPSSTNLRVAGVRAGLQDADPCAVIKFCVGDPEDLDFVRAFCHRKEPFDAAVCPNDKTAAYLMRSFLQLEKRIPKDISMVGFDDTGYAELLPVPLTSVRQPCRAIGLSCMDALLGRLAHPELPARRIFLPGVLAVRASTIKN